MGKIDNFKIALILFCFIITSIFIHWQPESKPTKKKELLTSTLGQLDHWTMLRSTPFEKSVVDSLELDDYLNQDYLNDQNKKDILWLYIGYYYTSGKIGAAHDPLVCFPGQGWVVKDRSSGKLTLDKTKQISISYSTMIVEKGQEKQFILYWFQSYDKTSPDTFSQKFSAIWAKVMKKREDNAFVRISISIGDEPIASQKEAVLDFVRSFYPVFLNYVQH
jgi:EpsI family protein